MDMHGKKGIIMGVANKFSIAYGISEQLNKNGAELAFTVASDYFKEKVEPIINEQFNGGHIEVCDVSKPDEIARAFSAIKNKIGKIDFIVHSIAFSDKNELRGMFVDTTRDNFLNTMNISVYSFVEVCKCSQAVFGERGGSILALSYYGAEKVVQNYNVMGVAKSALESSVRYAAADLGQFGIRINAISSGPIKTLASSGIGGYSGILGYTRSIVPLHKDVSLECVGNAAVFLLSDASAEITGEVLHVDCGFNIMGLHKKD